VGIPFPGGWRLPKDFLAFLQEHVSRLAAPHVEGMVDAVGERRAVAEREHVVIVKGPEGFFAVRWEQPDDGDPARITRVRKRSTRIETESWLQRWLRCMLVRCPAESQGAWPRVHECTNVACPLSGPDDSTGFDRRNVAPINDVTVERDAIDIEEHIGISASCFRQALHRRAVQQMQLCPRCCSRAELHLFQLEPEMREYPRLRLDDFARDIRRIR